MIQLGTSSHSSFSELEGYTRINVAPRSSSEGNQYGVTLVTSGREGGGTGDEYGADVIALPAGLWRMLSGLGQLTVTRRKT